MNIKLTNRIILGIFIQIFILSSFVCSVYAENPVEINYTYDEWGNLIMIDREIVAEIPPEDEEDDGDDEEEPDYDVIAIRKAVASSFEGIGLEADKAIGGDFSVRWSSYFNRFEYDSDDDNQWIYLELVQPTKINKVKLYWETAYGRAYKIQVSDDGNNWTGVYSTDNGVGGLDEIKFNSVVTRYVRMYGIKRGINCWGYSLWEFEVIYDNSIVITADCSSIENENYGAERAFDNNYSSRWSSDFSDPQWIYIDLHQVKQINNVKLYWEIAYGRAYKIQISDDLENWTDIYSTNSSDGGLDNITFNPVTTQYVRMYGTERATPWGYSLWEFKAGYEEHPSIIATASSIQTADYTVDKAIDGNLNTRWSSHFSDPQWICLDLVQPRQISKVTLYWEAAYAKDYRIEVSDNAVDWTVIYSATDCDKGVDEIIFAPRTTQYVRMYGTKRGTKWLDTLWGYSLWEFVVE